MAKRLDSQRVRDLHVIGLIAERAVALAAEHGVPYTRMTAVLDIVNVHKVCPLRLDDLFRADDGNFAHDVFGIRRHLDRKTKRLGGCFLPRYAKPQGGE